MVIVYWVLLTIAGTVALFYRSRAKYFESLFELSKGYEPSIAITDTILKDHLNESLESMFDSKLNKEVSRLNKDGSIAKKRGRKPKLNKEN